MMIKHMHKQCAPGALSPPPPPRLGTTLQVALHCRYVNLPSQVGIAELCCHNYTVGSYLSEHAGTSFVHENRIFHQFMKSFLPQKFLAKQYISLF